MPALEKKLERREIRGTLEIMLRSQRRERTRTREEKSIFGIGHLGRENTEASGSIGNKTREENEGLRRNQETKQEKRKHM